MADEDSCSSIFQKVLKWGICSKGNVFLKASTSSLCPLVTLTRQQNLKPNVGVAKKKDWHQKNVLKMQKQNDEFKNLAHNEIWGISARSFLCCITQIQPWFWKPHVKFAQRILSYLAVWTSAAWNTSS